MEPHVDRFPAHLPTFSSEKPDDPPSPSGLTSQGKGLVHKVPPRRRSPEGPHATAAEEIFPAAMFDRPTTVFLYGPCRPLVNLALYAFAEASNPRFQWVDIGVPGEHRVPTDPVAMGWIPEERLWAVEHPSELRPNDLAANLALSGLIRSDEPSESLVRITEFLRLPDISQRLLANRPEDGRPGVLAVTNAHRVLAIYKSRQVAPLLGAHTSAGFSVLVGYADEPGPARSFFDYVFRIECEHLTAWREGRLVCEKGIASGPLRDGHAIPLPQVPLLARTFLRAESPE